MEKRIYEPMQIENLKDMLKKSGELYGDRPAFKYKTENPNEFRIITHKQFRKEVDYSTSFHLFLNNWLISFHHMLLDPLM